MDSLVRHHRASRDRVDHHHGIRAGHRQTGLGGLGHLKRTRAPHRRNELVRLRGWEGGGDCEGQTALLAQQVLGLDADAARGAQQFIECRVGTVVVPSDPPQRRVATSQLHPLALWATVHHWRGRFFHLPHELAKCTRGRWGGWVRSDGTIRVATLRGFFFAENLGDCVMSYKKSFSA